MTPVDFLSSLSAHLKDDNSDDSDIVQGLVVKACDNRTSSTMHWSTSGASSACSLFTMTMALRRCAVECVLHVQRRCLVFCLCTECNCECISLWSTLIPNPPQGRMTYPSPRNRLNRRRRR